MKTTNYFCNVCYKTYTEYFNGLKFTDKNNNPLNKDDPLITGKCDKCKYGFLKID